MVLLLYSNPSNALEFEYAGFRVNREQQVVNLEVQSAVASVRSCCLQAWLTVREKVCHKLDVDLLLFLRPMRRRR